MPKRDNHVYAFYKGDYLLIDDISVDIDTKGDIERLKNILRS